LAFFVYVIKRLVQSKVQKSPYYDVTITVYNELGIF